MNRHDGRGPDELRQIRIETGVLDFAAGSVMVHFGRTRVLCAASVSEEVPRWMRGKGTGWITSEYSMLPASTGERSDRESVRGKIGGRTHEIQRLIGRSLRMAVDLGELGEQLITVDCDVIQADGGTRTAAITGGWVALALAMQRLVDDGALAAMPELRQIAAVSAGVVGGDVVCDLDYVEDSSAEVDLNVVAAGDGRLIEVQGTAEGEPFDRAQLDAMVDTALAGIRQLAQLQRAALEAAR